MTAFERRWAILLALCKRRNETRENLACEFGVSKRTIETDVMYLSLRFPLYTKQGRGGGIFIVSGFRLDRPSMKEKQICLLNKLAVLLCGEDRKTILELIKIYG